MPPARFRTVYLIADRTLTVSNLVLPDGETTDFTRNELRMAR